VEENQIVPSHTVHVPFSLRRWLPDDPDIPSRVVFFYVAKTRMLVGPFSTVGATYNMPADDAGLGCRIEVLPPHTVPFALYETEWQHLLPTIERRRQLNHEQTEALVYILQRIGVSQTTPIIKKTLVSKKILPLPLPPSPSPSPSLIAIAKETEEEEEKKKNQKVETHDQDSRHLLDNIFAPCTLPTDENKTDDRVIWMPDSKDAIYARFACFVSQQFC
jgi:hypothetical protein